VPGGRLVFLLPTTVPFTEALLPAHPGLILHEASEQLMAARWSRWCITMCREALSENGNAPAPSAPFRCWRATAQDATSSASVQSATIFARASLRPDDAANADQKQALAAATDNVLHPHLLGKSAGSRRRLEKRLQRVEAGAVKASSAGGDSVAEPYADLCGSSNRATRRQARNRGRGEYEEQVRERLGNAAPSWWESHSPRFAGALVALLMIGAAAAVARSSTMHRSR
jgi:hypothetical protein